MGFIQVDAAELAALRNLRAAIEVAPIRRCLRVDAGDEGSTSYEGTIELGPVDCLPGTRFVVIPADEIGR